MLYKLSGIYKQLDDMAAAVGTLQDFIDNTDSADARVDKVQEWLDKIEGNN